MYFITNKNFIFWCMSKSKKNTIDPEQIIENYGADSVRLFMLSDSPPEKDVQWSDQGIVACYKFIQKLWNLHEKIKDKLKNKLNYKYIPLESVGIYVPGGTAAYPSTVLMNAIPARLANVKRIVLANPNQNGKLNSAVLYAAKKLKIDEIYSMTDKMIEAHGNYLPKYH